MRIAVLPGAFPVLSETFILNQVTGLVEMGHDVQIFAARPREVPAMHPDVQKFGLLERTHYWPRGVRGTARAAAKVLAREGLGAAERVLRSFDRKVSASEARPLARLARAVTPLEAGRFDAVLCHYGPEALTGQWLREIGALEGPLAAVFHGYDVSQYLREHGPDVYRPLFEAGELMLPISKHWRDRLVELGCPEDKVRVHHMGIDCGAFELASKRVGRDRRIVILSIGRMVEKKGFEYGLRAFARLSPKNPTLEYHIVGDGPLRSRLEGLVDQLGIRPKVVLHGWKPQDAVIDLYDKAHVFLAPSVTAADGDQEGIPVVLMEAMAVGMPVLTTQHSGIPELVKDGGTLVAERDVPALADRLLELVSAPESWPAIGRRGRKIVEKEFDVRKLNGALVKLLQDLPGGAPAAPAGGDGSKGGTA